MDDGAVRVDTGGVEVVGVGAAAIEPGDQERPVGSDRGKALRAGPGGDRDAGRVEDRAVGGDPGTADVGAPGPDDEVPVVRSGDPGPVALAVRGDREPARLHD